MFTDTLNKKFWSDALFIAGGGFVVWGGVMIGIGFM